MDGGKDLTKVFVVEGLYASHTSETFRYWSMVAFPNYGYGVFRSRGKAERMVAKTDLTKMGVHALDRLVKVRIKKQEL